MLDKGQEDDWFDSPFITGFSIVAAVCAGGVRALGAASSTHPIVDVRLFANRNFAAANVMMLMLGVVLYGSTVLLPQYLQLLMGYTAQQAGHGAVAGRLRGHGADAGGRRAHVRGSTRAV